MISRAGLNPTQVKTYKPGDESYRIAKDYMADSTKDMFATIKDSFLAEDGKAHDLNGSDNAVELDQQDLFIFLGPGSGGPGRGLYTGEADADSIEYRHTYSDHPGDDTHFGKMETSEDGTVSMLTARHYGDRDHAPNYSLITMQPNGIITTESGVPNADFDPVMATRGTQPYLGELEGGF